MTAGRVCTPDTPPPRARSTARPGPHGHAVAAAVALLLLPAGARAHATGLSFLDLSVDGSQVRGALDLPAADLSPLLGLAANRNGLVGEPELREREAALVSWLGQNLRMLADGAPCDPGAGSAELRDGTLLTIRLTWACRGEIRVLEVRSSIGETIGSGYSTFVQLQRRGSPPDRTLLTGDQTGHSFDLVRHESAWQTAREFASLGVFHIFTGYDHILFLLALLMLGGRLSRVIGLASAFTVAHTITLSLAATNMVSLPARLTESAIAASIAYVALENWFYARPPPPGQREPLGRLRWVLTFGFGLVHGFGFASALAERGLPHAHIPLALASFNVGVELGQVAIIAVAYPLLRQAGRQRWYRPQGVRFASVGVFTVALYWFVQRAFAG